MRTDPIVIDGSARVGERMFAQPGALFKGFLVLLCSVALTSCGGDEPTGSPTAAEADTAGADQADVQVIENWASTLAKGDVEAAADYFAIPSTAENGALLTKIESRADAVAFNRSLPCGAEVVSAKTAGDFTTATFELADRPGGACGAGVGGTASTSFQIEDGKIVEWRRIDHAPPTSDPDAGTEV
jgi:limonene-1,2-epoxide hydrolase